jgi:hypothetical protein
MHRVGFVAALLVSAVLCYGCRSLEGHLPPVVVPTPDDPATAGGSRHLVGSGASDATPEVILTPTRTRGPAALTAGLIAPVRMQIGPQPFVVESCNLKAGDKVRIAIREPGGEEPLHVREYSMAGGLVSTDGGLDDWSPEPGGYEAELWVNGQLLDTRPFTVH